MTGPVPPLKRPQNGSRLGRLLIPIALIHGLLIFGPLVYYRILDHFKPPEENLFRVKIGGRELSHAEHVGKPERKAPGFPAPPPAAEPEAAAVPPTPTPAAEPDASAAAAELAARRAAVIEQQKRAALQKKKAELRKKQLAEKRRQEQLKKKKLAELQKKKALEQKRADAKRKAEAERRRKAAAEAERRRKANDVYRPTDRKALLGRRSDGGTNTNGKVPIGARDVGQKYGKQDNRDPGGGANEKVEVYGLQKLVPYLKTKWDEPPDSLLAGRRPEVLIELTIEGSGRVTASRIVKRSGIRAMDESVEILLKKLDSVPMPPERVTLTVVLKTNDL